MSKPTRIICPSCEESCGKEYPADHTDPGYREGIGENFTTQNGTDFGVWHCSQNCLDQANYEQSICSPNSPAQAEFVTKEAT